MRGAKRLKPKNNAGVALLALAIIVPLVFLGFTKTIPFKPQYEIKAAFESSNNLKKGSPVRIAGVEVGKVTKVEPASKDSEAVMVTMTVGKSGRPVLLEGGDMAGINSSVATAWDGSLGGGPGGGICAGLHHPRQRRHHPGRGG